MFAELNRGKRSLVLDLGRERGIRILHELACKADVLVENFSPRVLESWGLAGAAILQENPRLVLVRLPGFGCSGPRRDDVSYGPTLQALAGHTLAMRRPREAPAGWGFSFSDSAAGVHAALAALAALWWRERTGRGQQVEVSQYEVLVSLTGPDLVGVLNGRPDPGALGERPPLGEPCPHGVFSCAPREGRERWIALSVWNDAQWRALAALCGRPWVSERRFSTAAGRLRHRRVLHERVGEWVSGRDAERLAEDLQQAGVPAAVLADARDLCTRDPHLHARGFWRRVSLPEGGEAVLQAPVPCLHSTPGGPAGPAPLLGEHGAEVLREWLGLEQSALDRLRAEGVVA